MTGFQAVAMSLVVVGGVLYHLSQKSVPAKAHLLTVLGHAYLVAAALSLGLAAVLSREGAGELIRFWPISLFLGVAVLLIEAGILLVYRSGWAVGPVPLVSNLLVTLMLLPIGILWYAERPGWSQLAGMVLCVVGLALVLRR